MTEHLVIIGLGDKGQYISARVEVSALRAIELSWFGLGEDSRLVCTDDGQAGELKTAAEKVEWKSRLLSQLEIAFNDLYSSRGSLMESRLSGAQEDVRKCLQGRDRWDLTAAEDKKCLDDLIIFASPPGGQWYEELERSGILLISVFGREQCRDWMETMNPEYNRQGAELIWRMRLLADHFRSNSTF